MKDIKGIIFDYGGTLDSRGDHWSEVIWRAYMAVGMTVSREAFRNAYVAVERALDGSGVILPSDTFRDVMHKKIALQFKALDIDNPQLSQSIADRCYTSARACVSEAAVTLARLSSRYPLAVVSNFYGNIRAVLADFGILRYMNAVIDSTEAGIRKPDPRIFAIGIQALSATLQAESGSCRPLCTAPGKERGATCFISPDQVLVVGDSIGKDIIPARTLGCHTALLPGTPWDTSGPQPPVPPDTIILDSLADLVHIVS